jgi:heme exporter protein CcmD
MDPLHVGKYAAYIVPAYGISAVVLLGLVLQTLLAARSARRRAEGDKGSGDKAGEP